MALETIYSESFWDYCKKLENEDFNKIALRSQKQDVKYDRFDILRQVEGLKTARYKLPSWYTEKILYPTKISLEQCSSEPTAKYKQQIVDAGESMIDLTGGFGVDCFHLSQKFGKAHYNEQQQELFRIVNYNFNLLGERKYSFSNASASEILEKLDRTDLIYLDPSRRDEIGRKTVLISDCEPNMEIFQGSLFEKTDQVLLKLSPMLDIDNATSILKHIDKVYIVSYKNECKELLFLLKKNARDIEFICTNIIGDDKILEYSFSKETERSIVAPINKVLKKYILEPNASVLKAGAFKSIAIDFELEKLHHNTHLYTSDRYITNFPGRIFELLETSSLNPKEIKTKLSKIKKANLSTRNFPLSTEALKRKLKINDGGDLYIFGTTIYNESKLLLICKKEM